MVSAQVGGDRPVTIGHALIDDISEFSDQALVLLFRAGHRGASFEEMYRRHHGWVLGRLRRLLGHHQDAEDIAHDAFERAYRALTDFRGEAALRTWVWAIAINTMRNFIVARNRRVPRQGLDAHGDWDESSAHPLAGRPGDDPYEVLAARYRRDDIEAAVGRLPPDIREALLLRERWLLPYEQIAEITHVPLGTVRSRISRGRRMVAAP